MLSCCLTDPERLLGLYQTATTNHMQAKNPQFAELRNGLAKKERYYNDPDQLLIGNNGLSRTEAEVQMGMWALWSAPMILSVEVRNGSLSAEMKAILTNQEVRRTETLARIYPLENVLTINVLCSHSIGVSK